MKIVINTSWDCQLNCPYCWLPHTKINRKAKEHTWQEWADAIVANVPQEAIIDFSGGEPFLFEGMVDILAALAGAGIRWAVTTNALASEAISQLVKARLTHCVVINVSDHSGNSKAHDNIIKMMRQYPVVVHRCDHPGAGNHESNAGKITYQRWKENEALDGITRMCSSGMRHFVIDPGGDVFRCCVDMQVANPPLSNIFKDGLEPLTEPEICDFGCSTCYTENPREWLVEMSAYETPDKS